MIYISRRVRSRKSVEYLVNGAVGGVLEEREKKISSQRFWKINFLPYDIMQIFNLKFQARARQSYITGTTSISATQG